MRIVCTGGGPAGSYFALPMKKQDPSNHITVFERNRPYDRFGCGVAFSNQTLETCGRRTRRRTPRSLRRSTTGTTSRSISRTAPSPPAATKLVFETDVQTDEGVS